MNTAMKSAWLLIILSVLASSCADDGKNGKNGLNGVDGMNGNPGTEITPVQLCSKDFVPTYPSTFPEYALCIAHQLYGVYSEHGGFLSVLPQGKYHSEGIHASCTITVGENCVVTREES